MCVCAQVCVHVSVCVLMCVWRIKVNERCLPQLLLALFFKTGSLTEPADYRFGGPGWSASSTVLPFSNHLLPAPGLQVFITAPFMWVLRIQTQACTTSSLPSESSPQPLPHPSHSSIFCRTLRLMLSLSHCEQCPGYCCLLHFLHKI